LRSVFDYKLTLRLLCCLGTCFEVLGPFLDAAEYISRLIDQFEGFRARVM